MPYWRQDILIGDHPICMFFIERDAFLLKQLLCYIIDLLGDDLFGKKGTIAPISDPLCAIRNSRDLYRIAVSIKQL